VTFEPTQPQDGVDPNMFTLIDPEAIPYPLTDAWSLNYAAETLRTGGENLLGGAEDMHSTWAGLQAHYVAPESETLFAAMDPVVTRGEDIQSDLATVADALEDLAEAASTARSSLNTLRIEAQSFWNKHHDKKVWWLDKDDETDEWALQENIRLKDGVNTAWATFNEAENACATRISALFGGPSYASPDQAGGDDVLVYGLPTDAGERELPEFGDMGPVNDFTAWLGTEFHPSTANFSSSTGQAAWDNLLVDGLWGSAVGLVGLSGLWHPQGGWQITPSGRWENAKNTVKDGWMDTMTFIGVHDEQGWVADGAEGTRWDRWTTNIGASWDQVVEGHTAWSRHEEDLEYTGATSTINTATWFVALPVKIGVTVLTLGPGGDVLTPSNRDGSYSDGDDHSYHSGGRLPVGPSSPLPQRLEEGSTPIGERFQHDLTLLRESLLDPDQYRNTPAPRSDAPSPTPNRPVVGDGGDQPSPTAPQHSDNTEQRAEDDPERRPTSRTDDDGTDGQDDDRPVRRDDAPSEEPARPETATGGGEGGGDQPPRDRTATGGDDSEEGESDRGESHRTPDTEVTPSSGVEASRGRDSLPGTGPEGAESNSRGETDQAASEKTLQSGKTISSELEAGGLTDSEVNQLIGGLGEGDDGWDRVFSALDQPFNKKVKPDLHGSATRFAFDGAGDAREFSYRYEYYKASFDELVKELVAEGMTKGQARQPAAAEILTWDMDERLRQDHEVVNEMRPNGHAYVDPAVPDSRVEQEIRNLAGSIEMGHDTSSAYHARKHKGEIPELERNGDPIRDYFNSAELTIRNGDIIDTSIADNGSRRFVFARPKLDVNGGQVLSGRTGSPVYMKAVLYLRLDGRIVMATYGGK
jgi:hypothetical protein